MMYIKIEVTGEDAVEFGVDSIPDRKNKFLYTTNGTEVEILAYFKSDKCVEKFENIMNFIFTNLASTRYISLKRGETK